MSGLLLILNRDGAPADSQILDASLGKLAHRGLDGSRAVIEQSIALGHQHFWTTPEELNERQPIADAAGRYFLLFDGRLDNRAELLAELGMSASQPALSDAGLLLYLYAEWGADCFARLVGPFALALYDRHEGRVTLVRDPMGVRSLFYHLSPRLLVVASEAQALLAHPAISSDINETGLARWYALHFPLDGQTIHRHISELPPAHALSVEQGHERLWTYWQPNSQKRIRYRDEREYAKQYGALLAESVRCRLRSTTPPAVMMSGGYDSTAVASLAALDLADKGRERLRVFSWIFDELASCDERPQIEAVNAAYDMQATFIAADEAYPLSDWDSFPLDPGMPATNAYRPLLTRTYRAVSEAGSRVLLTGASGDNLFSGAEYWLLDLLREGRLVAAWRGLHAPRQGHPRIHWRMHRAAYWRLGGWLLDGVPGGRRLRPRRQPLPPDWLTAHALEQLQWSRSDFAASGYARPEQAQSLLEAAAAPGPAVETFHAARVGIERRFPYRDRRLVEFILSIPAHQLYSEGRYKAIAYHAMRGILPETVRMRPGRGDLAPLFLRGMVEGERATVQAQLDKPDALWRRYLRPQAVESMWNQLQDSGQGGAYGLALWFCVAIELWSEGRVGLVAS